MFERLSWQENHIFIDDLIFYLDKNKSDTPYNDGFLLEKPKRLIEQYEAIWQSRSEESFKNILELGIYGGGSIIFWFELLKPEKYVALDLAASGDTDYFSKYVTSNNLEDRIKTFWKTNQADRTALKKIISMEYKAPLDLVIDDASHLYNETKVSFETLFPLLRPGGLYIIEDWSWGCWPNLPLNFLPAGTELPKLIHQIINAAGSMARFLGNESDNPKLRTLNPLISSVTTYADIIVIERGGAEIKKGDEFKLEDYITIRPHVSILRGSLQRSIAKAPRFVSRSLRILGIR